MVCLDFQKQENPAFQNAVGVGALRFSGMGERASIATEKTHFLALKDDTV